MDGIIAVGAPLFDALYYSLWSWRRARFTVL
jgi:hypothetical protein